MKLLRLPCIVCWLAGVLILLSACTKSPFNDDVTPPPTRISGQIDLHRPDNDNSNVYVWLEGIDVSTTSDSSGQFVLELPRERISDATGTYRLFCFMANYTVKTFNIVIQNGDVQYGQGVLDAFGRIQSTIDLFKTLDVFTIVQPRSAASTFTDQVRVLVTLQAIVDSVAVIFPKSVGGLLGGLFFRHETTGQVFIDIPDQGADTQETILVSTEQTLSRQGVFQFNGANSRDLFLPVGDYEVIPYFFIENIRLPAQLLQSLGEHVQEPHPEFLNIPVKREGGKFRVF